MAGATERPSSRWRGFDADLGAIGLLVVASGCALWLMLGPSRPLAPRELPSLQLAEAPVRAAIAEDRERAAQTPASEVARELDDSFLAEGRAEYALTELREAHARRAAARRELVAQLVAAHGRDALWALRAAAVVRFERALSDPTAVDDAALPGILGVVPNQLAGVGITREGRELAPTFVSRVVYKARWNRIHGLPEGAGLRPIERQAYFGWWALHAEREPLPARLSALRAYAEAGGRHVSEALGVLLYRAGDYRGAAEAFAQAFETRPLVRLRNYRDGARLLAEWGPRPAAPEPALPQPSAPL